MKKSIGLSTLALIRDWLTPCLLFTALLSQGLMAAELATVRVGAVTFKAEVAQTDEELHRGLMFRRQLPADQGMLFIQPAGPAEFWMKNTLIPLDLLYFDANGTLIEIVARAEPCKQRNCPTYPSQSASVRYILEINGGEAARRALKIGDPLGLE
ncbi:MAG TPA: DUF192 domain-containing protein [Lamprocystis sp. (in: g-proteobacteria)]|nr:DUF192 domain-containing protein [Lamprocystis sp. (in: g-proteobacteria)]